MFAAFDYHVYSKIFFLYWNWFLQVWTSSKINQKNLLNVTLGYRLLENCECVQIVSIISILHVCSSMRVQNESFSSLTPRPNCNSPYCQPYNSYVLSSENLVLDQLIIPKFIFFFILITYLVDIVLIFLGEVLSWSLMGVKGLTTI